MQGLVTTNPEDDSKMDVVGIVPSVSFRPKTDLHGSILLAYCLWRAMSILSGNFWKGNHSLKPHQSGMAKTGDVQQG